MAKVYMLGLIPDTKNGVGNFPEFFGYVTYPLLPRFECVYG